MYCPKCGYSAGESDSFCKMCGCDLSAHTNLQETNTSQQAIEKTDLPSKKNIAGFVHSVADLEERYFTLIESSKKIKDEAIKKRKQADNELEVAKKEFGKTQEKLQARQKELSSIDTFRKYRKLNRSVGGFFGAFFAFIFIYGFTGTLAGTLLSALLELLIFGTSFEDSKFVFTIPILVILFAIYWCIYFALKVTNYKKTLKTQQKYVSNWQKSYSEAVERCKECEKSCAEAETSATHLLKKAEELELAANITRRNLTRLYEFGIIPPSYQNLICAALFDEIFINNKADSIREAVLLCDIELRHAEIVNKLNDINNSLQALAENMLFMSNLLHNINYNIESIASDISNISINQGRIAYATESIQQSADNADFYIAQRRAGSI